jgi:hypothetical protein
MSAASSDVFICFSSKDEKVARVVVSFLETEGFKCWISSRDVPPGQNYQETIVTAIERAKGIVFLLSEFSAASGEIKKELSLAASFAKPVFPVRLSAIAPSGALRYELATRQWIDLFPEPEPALRKLNDAIRQAFDDPGSSVPAEGQSQPVTPSAAQRMASSLIVSGSENFEAIRALLAHHIGPIARILVERAARETLTAEEFCARLAVHVSTEADREAFLRAARAHLAPKS